MILCVRRNFFEITTFPNRYREVVVEVEPIVFITNPGSYFYVMLILLCYASRRGLGLSVTIIDVSC